MLLFIFSDNILALDLTWLQRTLIQIEGLENTLLRRGRVAIPEIGDLHMIREVELSATPDSPL